MYSMGKLSEHRRTAKASMLTKPRCKDVAEAKKGFPCSDMLSAWRQKFRVPRRTSGNLMTKKQWTLNAEMAKHFAKGPLTDVPDNR